MKTAKSIGKITLARASVRTANLLTWNDWSIIIIIKVNINLFNYEQAVCAGS